MSTAPPLAVHRRALSAAPICIFHGYYKVLRMLVVGRPPQAYLHTVCSMIPTRIVWHLVVCGRLF